MSEVVPFSQLFTGNCLAYGGDEGRAVRCTKAQWFVAMAAHYRGDGPAIGVYPMRHTDAGWWVKWGCVDFDIKTDHHVKFDYEEEHEAHTAAVNLRRVLAAFGAVAWIERTRSHGRHVWVFPVEWTEASVMRRALMAASEIAGTATREVNPKSDGSNLSVDQLGNYVRLPYNGDGPERTILEGERSDCSMGRDWFIRAATESRTAPEVFERMATLYREPVPEIDWDRGSLDNYTGEVPRVVRHVIENGPNDGDRSKGLLYVAHECAKAGMAPATALELVGIADDAWGKYTGRRDREQRLQEIVERGYA